ncbi:MAG TPA: hypothetical protein VHZ26_05060 [Caulobacteraceae bacterium]|nr:hypothetical protein [Caulobacteraceae bacterium]
MFIWLCLVVLGVSHHVFWRDEVRALSLALQGDSPVGFFKAIHGEGHPAVWFVLLRSAYAIFRRPQVLPALALVVAIASMLILALRSPFKWPLIGLILFSHFALFEYSVTARNYGISMLLVFAFAALYPTHRRRGVVLGGLLFLLANCNVHSVILAGGFLLLWFIDLLQENGLKWTAAFRTFALNAAIAALGVVACALTVFPTYNDAGVATAPLSQAIPAAIKTIMDPASQFDELGVPRPVIASLPPQAIGLALAAQAVLSMLLFAATAGLIRRPGAFVAALASLIGLALLFAFGVEGGYRHQALWLVFLIALYWIHADPRGRLARPAAAQAVEGGFLIRRAGYFAFVALLSIQAIVGLFDVFDAVHPGNPWSRSRDLAQLVEGRPDLRQAVVIADPDYLVEPLAYYVSNPLFLMREHRFGAVVRFTKHAQLTLSLADVLANARWLHAQTGRPVVILLQNRLDQIAPNTPIKEGYDWVFSATPGQIHDFEAATIRLARLGPAITDETFDAYQLR